MVSGVKRIGRDILVNSDSTDFPFGNAPSIVRLANGGFIIFWSESNNGRTTTSGTGDVRARLFGPDGAPVGLEFVVNLTTNLAQALPSATLLNDGRVFVAWQDNSLTGGDATGSAIKALILSAAGAPIGDEVLINTTTTANQSAPAVSTLLDGNVLVAWTDSSATGGDTSGQAIRGQIVTSAGAKVGGEFLVNTNTASNQNAVQVATLTNGNAIVTWTDMSQTLGDTSAQSVKGQLIDQNGAKVGGEFLVNTVTTGNQNQADVAALPGGGFVITWTDASLGGSALKIKAQIFNAAGERIGTEFLVNTFTDGSQSAPMVATLDDGNFVITWRYANDAPAPSVPDQDIRGQIFTPDGVRVGSEFVAGASNNLIEGAPAVAALANGQFVVSSSSSVLVNSAQQTNGLHAQIFSSLPLVSGQIAGGVLEVGNDRDWFKLDVIAGQSYMLESIVGGTAYIVSDPSGTNPFDPAASAFLFAVASGDSPGHFTATATGTLYVEVAAPSSYLFTATPYLFRVTPVTDDFADNRQTTGTLSIGSPASGVLETEGDNDWFAVNLAANGSYEFKFTSPETSSFNFTLVDAAGNVAVADVGLTTNDGTVFTAPVAGTYYAILSDAGAYQAFSPQSYSLSVQTYADDYTDNAATTGVTSVGAVASGVGERQGDVDWFAVSLTANQSYRFGFTAIGNAVNGQMTITNASGSEVANATATGTGSAPPTFVNAQFTPDVSGIYYVAVTSNGTYSLRVSQAADDFTDNFQTTGTIQLGTARTGTWEENGDSDWFAVQLTANTSYRLRSDQPESNNFIGSSAVYDANGTAIAVGSTFNANSDQFTVATTGTYYVAATGLRFGPGGAAGTYSLRLDAVADDYVDNVTTTGRIAVDGIASGTWEGTGDDDWFATTLQAGQTYVTSASVSGIVGTDIDPFLSPFAFYDAAGAAVGLGTFTPTVSGTYYISAAAFSAASYTLRLDRIRDDHINTTATNGVFGRGQTGNSGASVLIGANEVDALDGGPGADGLAGGLGDDLYRVDRQDDLVFEMADGGYDTVFSSSNYYLYANVERLVLTSEGIDFSTGLGGAFFGVGNELDNDLVGNFGRNLLLGGGGNDQIDGGFGGDSLFGEAGDDRLYGGVGIDYLVGGDGSDFIDGGRDADALYGQGGDDQLIGGTGFVTDILVGGDGNDLLRGDGGAGDYDLLYGNLGNDIFYVDTPADLVFEEVGEGTDTVYANINGGGYYLYANIENLVLLGATPFGVGNALANQLTGNTIRNFLLGGAGDDSLNGKGGSDVLFGEAGADTFVFDRGTGGDVIGDFLAGTDKIDLSAFGFANFAAVQAATGQNGSDSFINLGNGDFIVLNGVASASLSAGDFILTAGQAADADLNPSLDAIFDPGGRARQCRHRTCPAGRPRL